MPSAGDTAPAQTQELGSFSFSKKKFGVQNDAGAPKYDKPPARVACKPKNRKKLHWSPPPGAYNLDMAESFKFHEVQPTGFGGNMDKIDRAKTGPAGDADRLKWVPGPDAYSIKAALNANNFSSQLPCQPSVKFSSASRDAAAKLYISPIDTGGIDGNIIQGTTSTPGPGAYSEGILKSKLSQTPLFSFGVKTKNVHETTPATGDTVGPGSYKLEGSVGRQTLSSMRSSTGASLGSGSRERAAQVASPGFSPIVNRSKTPGPGAYKLHPTMGRQVLSTADSAMRVSFSNGGERVSPMGPGKGNPGPGEYDWKSSMGNQFNSKFKNQQCFQFGKSQVFVGLLYFRCCSTRTLTLFFVTIIRLWTVCQARDLRATTTSDPPAVDQSVVWRVAVVVFWLLARPSCSLRSVVCLIGLFC
jgi:hypothetical protein